MSPRRRKQLTIKRCTVCKGVTAPSQAVKHTKWFAYDWSEKEWRGPFRNGYACGLHTFRRYE